MSDVFVSCRAERTEGGISLYFEGQSSKKCLRSQTLLEKKTWLASREGLGLSLADALLTGGLLQLLLRGLRGSNPSQVAALPFDVLRRAKLDSFVGMR